jgi:rhodanese-related sulfurtransferase
MSDEERRGRIEEMYAGYKEDFPNVPETTVGELAKLRAEDRVVVVDAREPAEVAVSRIPGALTLGEFREQAEQHGQKKVVVYCTIGVRSARSTAELADQGFDAHNLKGGILLWTHAGQPLADPNGKETRRVHVYGRKWALAAEGYEDVF